ncbi:MAG: hypothetical protein K5829_12875 [Treponema sp.]|nr:hypothetical protein [Treponema sp.]
MYDDVESDFWKDIFVHLQHKNMVRIGAERLSFEDLPSAFQKFSLAHPDLQPEIQIKDSNASWEIFVTSTIKLRLFFQSQIKASLLQQKGLDFVKIADAKFPYNPFPEISELLSKRDSYENQLYQLKEKSEKDSRKLKVAAEFIKAYASEKAAAKNITWKLEKKGESFLLVFSFSDKQNLEIQVSPKDFAQKIDEALNS